MVWLETDSIRKAREQYDSLASQLVDLEKEVVYRSGVREEARKLAVNAGKLMGQLGAIRVYTLGKEADSIPEKYLLAEKAGKKLGLEGPNDVYARVLEILDKYADGIDSLKPHLHSSKSVREFQENEGGVVEMIIGSMRALYNISLELKKDPYDGVRTVNNRNLFRAYLDQAYRGLKEFGQKLAQFRQKNTEDWEQVEHKIENIKPEIDGLRKEYYSKIDEQKALEKQAAPNRLQLLVLVPLTFALLFTGMNFMMGKFVSGDVVFYDTPNMAISFVVFCACAIVIGYLLGKD
jgi:hypothetical protein